MPALRYLGGRTGVLADAESGDEAKQSMEKLIYEYGGDFVQTIPKSEKRRIICRINDSM